MVRSKSSSSSSSCLKIITCGGGGGGGGGSIDDNDEDDDIEGKGGSMNKRGWSFRKRSTRHRVLSNTVISEIPSSSIKESPEPPTVPQKALSLWTEEIPPLSTSLNSKVANPVIRIENEVKIDPIISTQTVQVIASLVISENTNKTSQNQEESSAIIIQAAIRRYLAQKELLKYKNIVKLQAAFRGHLERRQASGTLRCVQAIVKMQALVRGRRARISLQGSVNVDKTDCKNEKISMGQVALGKEQSRSNTNVNYSSTEKLLTNGFARQLLESAPKKKRIHIKCDPSKPDSAWKWLERWVSVSSSDSAQAQKTGSSPGHREGVENIDSDAEIETCIPAEVVSDSNVAEAAAPLEYEENLITYDADNFKFQACHPSSSPKSDVTRKPQFDDVDFRKAQDTSSTDDASRMVMQIDATSQTIPVSIPNKSEAGSEQPRRSMKRVATEQPETEGKKLVFGSRKARNPAFAAVHSKFEELSSSAISGRSNSSSQVVGVESKFDSIASTAKSGTRKKELNLEENSICDEPRNHVGGSDCGTELSISSTLDSSDRSEVGGVEFEHETDVTGKISSEPHKTTDNSLIPQNLDVVANNSSVTSDSSSSCTISQQGKREDVVGASVEAPVHIKPPPLEQHPEKTALEMQFQMEIPADQEAYKSPEGSPKSHITVPESYGTPTSQVSVKAKRNKVDKSGFSQSRKSLSASKQSPSNPNHDSGARSSTEKLPRDSRNGKRRNSFGSSRSDHIDQDPRDSASSSLPSYMQATESARAKALTNSSPRSSPDVQDKDIYVKKRHSLPAANGKQVSPRMQRSMSQAQQGAKGNGTHTQDRKWQR